MRLYLEFVPEVLVVPTVAYYVFGRETVIASVFLISFSLVHNAAHIPCHWFRTKVFFIEFHCCSNSSLCFGFIDKEQCMVSVSF